MLNLRQGINHIIYQDKKGGKEKNQRTRNGEGIKNCSRLTSCDLDTLDVVVLDISCCCFVQSFEFNGSRVFLTPRE